MVRSVSSALPCLSRKGWRFLLAILWLVGLLCGILAYFSADDSDLSLMRITYAGSVSIVELLFITVLPFLLSAFAVSVSAPGWILPLCFCKAFVLAFLSVGILHSCGSAGWLVRCVLLFSNCTAAPVLYLFWLRLLPKCRFHFMWEAAVCFALIILIGSIDYRIISPILAYLIDF